MATIWIKRAYEPPGSDDGIRVLVDRVWPRGRTKQQLELHAWERDVAPSTDLRRWFGHRPERWDDFRKRYREELEARPEALVSLLRFAEQGRLTLVYGAKDAEHNQAVVLREVLEERLSAILRREADR